MPLGPLPRKTGSRLGGRHLRPLRGGLGRDPVPSFVPSQWGSGNRATVSPHWYDSLWCGPAVPHCARPSRVTQAVLLFAAGVARTKVPNPARGLGRRPIGKRSILAESPGVVQGANPNAECCQGLPGTPTGVQRSGGLQLGPFGPPQRLGPRLVGPYGPGRASTPLAVFRSAGGHPLARPMGLARLEG